MGKLANPQKFINFVHWSGGCGMNEITARLLTLRIAQFFLIMMRALRAFGFKEKFKKNCASAGNVMGHGLKNPYFKNVLKIWSKILTNINQK